MSINTLHTEPDLRVVLKWTIAGSGSVIADVMPPRALARSRAPPTASPNTHRVINGNSNGV